MDSRDREFEVKRLGTVREKLNERLEIVEKLLQSKRGEVISTRKDAFDNMPNSVRSFDDVVSLAAVETAVKAVEGTYATAAKEAALLRKLMNSAYFARIDFKERNEETEQVYIGVGSFFDAETYEFYVYDWRSPIASMFYEFDEGEAEYTCVDGIIRGELLLKRQFRISGGEIRYAYDSGANVNDEILGSILAQNVEAKLKTIISSIQREQNAIIRSGAKGNLVVLGAAGSGKTSVGLHRLAYLLFQQGQAFSAKNVLIISKNHVFNGYIAQVLPELGEADVPRVVFEDIIKDFSPGGFELYDYYEQAEYFLQEAEGIRRKSVEAKYSDGFLTFIDKFFEAFVFEPKDIMLEGFEHNGDVFEPAVLISGAELAFDLNETNKGLGFKSRLKRMFVYASGKISDYFAMNKEEIDKRINAMRRASWLSSDTETPMPTFHDLLEQTQARARAKLVKDSGLRSVQLYKRVLREYLQGVAHGEEIYEYTTENLNAGHLYFEDRLALMCVKLKVEEIPTAPHIKHVLIDEAQDYNVLQHHILKSLFSNAKFTVLGDLNQGVLPMLSMREEAALLDFYGGKNAEFMPLTKSYRSSRQINKLAATFIESEADRETEYFEREGSEPRLVAADTLTAAVAREILEALPADVNLICFLTKTAEKALEVYERLRTELSIFLVDNTAEVPASGVCIAPVMLSKGLEFDAVVIVDEQMEDRLCYLMCTRALHHLVVVVSKDREGYWRGRM